MKPRTIMTSGTVSYAPPVCPDKPLAPANAVKKTIASRHNSMLNFSAAFCSSLIAGDFKSSFNGFRAERSMGNFTVAIAAKYRLAEPSWQGGLGGNPQPEIRIAKNRRTANSDFGFGHSFGFLTSDFGFPPVPV